MELLVAAGIGMAVGLGGGYVLGFHERELQNIIAGLKDRLQAQLKRKSNESKSTILEPPLTPAERVAREQEELLERLNS